MGRIGKSIDLASQMKVFCISFQRTGTTSVGEFFKKNGYRVATYEVSSKNDWTKKWFDGDYKSILRSKDFLSNTVFEDDPWWCADFYKYLFNRFKRSKFILFTRNPNDWFDSMCSHSNHKTLGNAYIHTSLYNRYSELGNSEAHADLDTFDPLPLTEEYRSHYVEIYNNRNREIRRFFKRKDVSRLIHLELEDPEKWNTLAKEFKINWSGEEVHKNRSGR